MPNKRKRNAGDAPAAKRKVGAAPKRSGAQEEAGTVAAAEPGVTQPLDSSTPATPVVEGAPSAEDGPERSAAHTVPLGEGQDAPEPAEQPVAPVEDEGDSSASTLSEEGGSDRPHLKVIRAVADEASSSSDGDSGSDGKMTKRKSTRSERRRDRKKAKADKRAQMSAGRRAFRIVRTLVIVLAVLAVVAGGAAAAGISYHRWQAYDDALDIQGTWYVSGTDTPIEVTADTIVLADDVAYKYKLDPSSKTITFSFGNLKGEGHYRFSLDRQYLVIFDGSYTWEESLSTDVAWLIQALKDQFFGAPNDLAQGAFYNVTLLSRNSSDNSTVSASVVATPEGPRVVWSAPDAEGGSSDGAGNASAHGTSDGTSGSTSDSDMDALLGNLSDRPAS